MDASLKRRVMVSSCWASTRSAVLDSAQRYEDSYAITQEFREWITCLADHSELLEHSVVKVPIESNNPLIDQTIDSDEVLEI